MATCLARLAQHSEVFQQLRRKSGGKLGLVSDNAGEVNQLPAMLAGSNVAAAMLALAKAEATQQLPNRPRARVRPAGDGTDAARLARLRLRPEMAAGGSGLMLVNIKVSALRDTVTLPLGRRIVPAWASAALWSEKFEPRTSQLCGNKRECPAAEPLFHAAFPMSPWSSRLPNVAATCVAGFSIQRQRHAEISHSKRQFLNLAAIATH
jgi:hypothetical protein